MPDLGWLGLALMAYLVCRAVIGVIRCWAESDGFARSRSRSDW